MTKSRAARAPRPSAAPQPQSAVLAVTFQLDGQSVEAATALISRWLAGEVGQPLHPLKVISVRLDDQRAVPEPARRIAAHRRRLHLTQEDVAELAGVDRVTVNAVERGRISATSDGAVAIRQALAGAEGAR